MCSSDWKAHYMRWFSHGGGFSSHSEEFSEKSQRSQPDGEAKCVLGPQPSDGRGLAFCPPPAIVRIERESLPDFAPRFSWEPMPRACRARDACANSDGSGCKFHHRYHILRSATFQNLLFRLFAALLNSGQSASRFGLSARWLAAIGARVRQLNEASLIELPQGKMV